MDNEVTMDSKQTESILDELKQTFDGMDYANVDSFIQMIKKARHIVCAGVGREGLTCRAFCMRLMHLALTAIGYGMTRHRLLDLVIYLSLHVDLERLRISLQSPAWPRTRALQLLVAQAFLGARPHL